MRGSPRPIALFLLAPFLLAMLSAQSIALPTMPAGHPAGCHENEPTPSPAPVSYQCCVMGHHWAMPGTAYSTDLSVFTPLQHATLEARVPVVDLLQEIRDCVFSSASPPKALPLRI
jgi:hypothetical protein